MNKIEASNQLNYEVGIFMFRAVDTDTSTSKDYNVHDNFVGVVDELNNTFVFDKSTVLCGFENEWQNVYGDYDRDEISKLFSTANETYKINYN